MRVRKQAKVFQNLKTAFKGLAGVVGTIGLVSFIKNTINASVSTEKLLNQLINIHNDTKKGQEALKSFDKLTIKLGLSAEETQNAFLRLSAGGIEPTESILRSISDVANTFNISIERSARVLLRSSAGSTQAIKRLEEFGVLLSDVDKKTNTLTLSYNNQNVVIENTKEGYKNAFIELSKMEGIAGSTIAVMEGLDGKQKASNRSVDALYGTIGDFLNPTLKSYNDNINNIAQSLSVFYN